MNYRQLQAKLKSYRDQGHQIPALNSKKEILESAIKAIESKPKYATQSNVLDIMSVGYAMSLQEIAQRCGDSDTADIAGILLELELQGKVKQLHCNSYIYTGKPKTAADYYAEVADYYAEVAAQKLQNYSFSQLKIVAKAAMERGLCPRTYLRSKKQLAFFLCNWDIPSKSIWDEVLHPEQYVKDRTIGYVIGPEAILSA